MWKWTGMSDSPKKERPAFVEMPTGLSPSKERKVPYYSPNFHVQMSQKDKLK